MTVDIATLKARRAAFEQWFHKLQGGAYETASNVALAREAFCAGWLAASVLGKPITGERLQEAERHVDEDQNRSR
jgi:hypothetical protein